MSQVHKLFIDGEHGTTGLQIRERLAARTDLDLLSIPHAERHDRDRRMALLNEADVVVLCLPDAASREAVAMIEAAGNTRTRIIDTSTAFRTHDDWVYGFAEIAPGHGEAIARAKLVSNPGCYSTGAIALLRPLIDQGLMPADYPVTLHAVSGYTGGGKQLIAQMEDPDHVEAIPQAHFQYALQLAHKHVPEIEARTGLARRPVFMPSVARFPQGMLVNLPLHLGLLGDGVDAGAIHDALNRHYRQGGQVKLSALEESAGISKIFPEAMAGQDDMHIHVFADEGGHHVNLVAALDNLGKGASGAAVQNLDLMLGVGVSR